MSEKEIQFEEISAMLNPDQFKILENYFREKFLSEEKNTQTVETPKEKTKEPKGSKPTIFEIDLTKKTKETKTENSEQKKEGFFTRFVKRGYDKKTAKEKVIAETAEEHIKKTEEKIEKLRLLIADEHTQITGLINGNSFLKSADKEDKKIKRILNLVILAHSAEIEKRKTRVAKYEARISSLEKSIETNEDAKNKADQKVQDYERRKRAIDELKNKGVTNPALIVFLSQKSDHVIKAMEQFFFREIPSEKLENISNVPDLKYEVRNSSRENFLILCYKKEDDEAFSSILSA